MRFTVLVRASKTQGTGILGIEAVEKAFSTLIWAPLNTSKFDIGTDLVLMARDARRFDLGLYVGAQVKSGPSHFKKPEKDGDAITGWWWYDPKPEKHLNAWASFPLPQLLILHDLEKDESYWVHVTPERVESTGKGAKILVPASNTIDEEHFDELIAVAGSVRGRVELEGSAWTPGRTFPALDQLRYALVVPRLIAPHPNAGKEEPLTPAQGLALATQARVSELRQFAEQHEEVPTPEEACESDDFAWRLVGGLVRWLHGKGTDGLRSVALEASEPHVRVAAIVAVTTALISEGLVHEARSIVEQELARDQASPVDHAWLMAQHARICLDLGDIEAARAQAGRVLSVGAISPGDVTATAIAGAAAIKLYNSASWGEQSVSTVISAADTTASWWRAQITAVGLEAVTERSFSAWASDRTVTITREDVANNRLISAGLLASNAADHGGWRHLAGLLGQDMLMRLDRHADPEHVDDALGTLRLAGAEKAIKLAVPQLVANGPAAGVTGAAREVDLENATRTTLLSDLSLLQYGADVLDSDTAESAMNWLLKQVGDPSDLERWSGTYFLELRLLETLSQVLPGGTPEQHAAVIKYLAALPPYDKDNPGRQEALSQWWARLVENIPAKAWTSDRLRRLGARADDFPPALSFAIRGLLAKEDDNARRRLLNEVGAGSLLALQALGNVTELSADVVASAISGLSQRVDGIIERAHNHTYEAGHDVGEALALLNAWHPSVAAWDPLYRLLEDHAVSDGDKSGALALLAGHANRLPEEVRTSLKPIAAAIAQKESPVQGFSLSDQTDARGVAALLEAGLGALDGADAANRVIELLRGDAQDRQWAVHVAHRLGTTEYTGILVALSDDQDVAVRATAAAALAVLVADDAGGPLAATALLHATREPGVLVPKEIARVLGSADTLPTPAARALDELRSHPSAGVRALALSRAPND
jgi:Domain of unknown function (DUF4365)